MSLSVCVYLGARAGQGSQWADAARQAGNEAARLSRLRRLDLTGPAPARPAQCLCLAHRPCHAIGLAGRRQNCPPARPAPCLPERPVMLLAAQPARPAWAVAVLRVGRTDSSTISVDKPSVFGGDPVVRVGDGGVLQK